jgi:hypothetical protein
MLEHERPENDVVALADLGDFPNVYAVSDREQMFRISIDDILYGEEDTTTQLFSEVARETGAAGPDLQNSAMPPRCYLRDVGAYGGPEFRLRVHALECVVGLAAGVEIAQAVFELRAARIVFGSKERIH